MATIDESLIACTGCGEINKRQSKICKKCKDPLGFPIVNIIDVPSEIDALNLRYQVANDYANTNALSTELKLLEEEVAKNGQVVVNLRFKTLYTLLTTTEEYKTYYQLVDAGDREVTDMENETKRSMVDSWLFSSPSIFEKVCYGVLSTHNDGLLNYGPYTVALVASDIQKRTTFLEENSWFFAQKHQKPLSLPPKGYRSKWDDKHKLVVAKLYKKLSKGITTGDVSSLILKNGADRSTDEFLEAYIYGNFDSGNIKSVTGETAELEKEAEGIAKPHRKKKALADIRRIKARLGAKWIERI